MKGFPNQVADFGKLATGLQVALDLAQAGENAKDNGVFGSALVRAGVAGTGHTPMPVDEYLAAQELKVAGNQGHRTAARGLRELYRRLGLIDDSGDELEVTPLGQQAAAFADLPLDEDQQTFWRTALSTMTHDGGGSVSHPYLVLLRLISRRPGITRAKCALALEAASDSEAELDRIVALSDLPEEEIIDAIGVSRSNWDNAKKMLPRFAEQIGDVVKEGQTYTIAENAGSVAPTREESVAATPQTDVAAPRATRNPRAVDPETIGQAGMGEQSEPLPPPDPDPDRMANAIATRADRVRRHNTIVRALAAELHQRGYTLYEDPFDILAVRDRVALLIEVKTLDGSASDERDRVRDALAQVLYYEAFVTEPLTQGAEIAKIACFEHQPSNEHISWLNGQSIETIWNNDGHFVNEHGEPSWLL